LNNPKALSEKMGNKVTSAVQTASRGLSDLIQREIQEGINREVERLKDFTQSVDEALKRIEVKFVEIPIDANRKTNATGEAITAVISTLQHLVEFGRDIV
jgi:UDP-glucose 6-dehydrogenase